MTEPCSCCSTVPRDQRGPCNSVLKNENVLEWIKEFRGRPGNLRKPLKDVLCGAEAVSLGGSKCRKEEGCENKTNQCLIYAITAPYYQVNMPFLISDKEIKKSVENLLKRTEQQKSWMGRTRLLQIRRKWSTDSTWIISFKSSLTMLRSTCVPVQQGTCNVLCQFFTGYLFHCFILLSCT